MEIQCNGSFSNFKELQLNNVKIDSTNYTAVSGSTIVTLKASYINTLTKGDYTLKFVYNDGRFAKTTLKVANEPKHYVTSDTDEEDDIDSSDEIKTDLSPNTGDNILNYIILMVISLFGVFISYRCFKKMNRLEN